MSNSEKRKLVTISVGDSDDLAELGYGTEHVDSFTIRLVSLLVGMDYDIGYGGVLRSTKGFTETILGVMKEYESQGGEDDAEARMINYQGWPWYKFLTPEKISDTLDQCRYVLVPPPESENQPFPNKSVKTEEETFHMARATTRMREVMVTGNARDIDGNVIPESAARVVLAGKIRGWTGVLPGIAEEVLLTLKHGKPIYLIGCFGGAARVLCDAFWNKDRVELTAQYHRTQTENASAQQQFLAAEAAYAGKGRSDIEEQFEELSQLIANVRETFAGREIKDAKGAQWVDNGLSVEENKQLFYTENVVTINRLIGKGLTELFDN